MTMAPCEASISHSAGPMKTSACVTSARLPCKLCAVMSAPLHRGDQAGVFQRGGAVAGGLAVFGDQQHGLESLH